MQFPRGRSVLVVILLLDISGHEKREAYTDAKAEFISATVQRGVDQVDRD
jgi:hypothetical protein